MSIGSQVLEIAAREGVPAPNKTAAVYLPRAVAYGPAHAHEGGGGRTATIGEAIRLGATEIRPSRDGIGLVATWPQSYWPLPEGHPDCPCGSCAFKRRIG